VFSQLTVTKMRL